MLKQIVLVGMVVLVSTASALAQITPTNSCVGQPTGLGASGDQTINPAFLTGFTDSMDTSGGNCNDLGAGSIDSVWCFRATTTCAIAFSLDPGVGNVGQITVANFGLGAAVCSNTVTNCTPPLSDQDGPGAQGVTVTVSNFSCPAGELICVYGATGGPAGTGIFTTVGADLCGDLPVKVQSFTVDSEKAEPEAENDDKR